MNKKEKQLEKSKKIRNIIKWVAVGLGWSALAFCFFGLLTLGIKGCVNKQNQQTKVTTPLKKKAVNNTYDHIYYYNGNVYDQLNYTSNHYVVDFVGYGDLHGNLNYFDIVDFTLRQGNSINVLFYHGDDLMFQYTASYNTGGKYNLPDESYWDILYLKLETALDVNDESVPSVVTSFFNQVFNEDLNYHLHFNDYINRFAIFNGGTSDIYFYPSDLHGVYNIFKGLFSDNLGNYYRQISLTYVNGQASAFGSSPDEYNVNTASSTEYVNMYYVGSNNIIYVANTCNYMTSQAKDHVGSLMVTKTSSWTSNIYQDITIHYVIQNNGYDDSPSANDDRITLLTKFNNIGNNSGLTLGNTDIGGNPLDLIGKAFGGLGSLFSISIIPGITFGVLLFLPLTAGIVLAIVKVVRK